MISYLFHFLLLLGAGVALFLLWRKTTLLADPWMNLMIAAGFLARAVLAQALFWISYASLPVARSLQLGKGVWFFALDALQYYPLAIAGAHSGIWTIVSYPRKESSVSFIQALSMSVLLFGEVTSVALLLNLFCYLGMTYLIVRWASLYERSQIPARTAIAAIAFSPAFILWSSQPLKDSLFQFVVVALIASCVAWQEAAMSGTGPWPQLGIAALMCLALYIVAGIRWYFAFIILIAACAFVLLVAFKAAGRRALAFGSAMVLLLVLSRAFLFGAGPYAPATIRGILNLNPSRSTPAALPSGLVHDVESAREGFERSGGSTQIALGNQLARLDQATARKDDSAARPEPHPELSRRLPSEHGDPSAQAPPSNAETARQLPPPRMPAFLSHTSNSKFITAPGPEKKPAPTRRESPASVAAGAGSPARQPPAAPSNPIASQKTPPIHQPPAPSTQTTPSHQGAPSDQASSVTSAANPVSTSANPPAVDRATPRPMAASRPKARPRTKPPAAATPATVVPQPRAVQAPPVASNPPAAHPAPAITQAPPAAPVATRAARLFAGAGALLVPSSIGQWIGLFQIGGGHAFLWFSDLDTIVFDLVGFAAIFWVIRAIRSGSLRNPIFWMIAAVTLMITVPLAYTVTNFGTLFRLREMIYIGLALIPLSLAMVRKQTTPR